ncbi:MULTISPECIES: cytochrome oxidase small assembly protein [unclassified Undibacterium]|uniref:cytochrome oxidase small assembly protein n=1 Tax=unclassified Undibacterium TaxID=2630295 RepID=UPI002B22E122|nr:MULTISPECIES: cytochrome oxidase small assembly protein [unclassified Undibacterium]
MGRKVWSGLCRVRRRSIPLKYHRSLNKKEATQRFALRHLHMKNEKKPNNLRTALLLFSVAIVFFIGVILKQSVLR